MIIACKAVVEFGFFLVLGQIVFILIAKSFDLMCDLGRFWDFGNGELEEANPSMFMKVVYMKLELNLMKVFSRSNSCQNIVIIEGPCLQRFELLQKKNLCHSVWLMFDVF